MGHRQVPLDHACQGGMSQSLGRLFAHADGCDVMWSNRDRNDVWRQG